MWWPWQRITAIQQPILVFKYLLGREEKRRRRRRRRRKEEGGDCKMTKEKKGLMIIP